MAAQRAPGDFGSKLREARERRGLSLRQIANATKISILALEALERNEIKKLPGGIFSRAFVRSYAIEVGLDPEATIQEFMGQFPHDSVTAGHPAAVHVEDLAAVEGSRRMAATIVGLIAICIPVAALMLYFGASRRSASVPAEETPAAPAAIAASAQPAEAELEPAPSVAGPVAEPVLSALPRSADRLVIRLAANKACRISAIVDGQKAFERVLRPGDRQDFDVQREIVFTADDAGALSVMLNGQAARPLGRDGERVTTRLDLANFKDYLTAR